MNIVRPVNLIVALMCTFVAFIPPIDVWSGICLAAAALNYWFAFSE